MLDDLWNAAAHVFWIFISETKHSSVENNLLVNRQENSLHPRMCEPATWRPRVSADFPEPGGVGGQSSAPLPSPERMSFLPPSCFWWQFAQGRYRLCSFQSLDIPCFHRETNIKRTEAVWTVQEGQSWGNYSYPTGVQTLSRSQLNP